MKKEYWKNGYQALRRGIKTSQFIVIAHAKSVGVAINHVLINQAVLSLQGLKRPDNLRSLQSLCKQLSEIATTGFLSKEDGKQFKIQLLLMRGLYYPSKRSHMGTERAKENFEKHKQRTVGFRIQIEYQLLDSPVFLTLTYAPTIKVLLWCFEKRKLEVQSRQKKGKGVRFIDPKKPFSFSYDEANYRGLSDSQFSRALKELHTHGFIDVVTHGSGLSGDYSTYLLSDRWKDWGTSAFKSVEFPKSASFGFRRG